jgi:hypothetical protein
MKLGRFVGAFNRIVPISYIAAADLDLAGKHRAVGILQLSESWLAHCSARVSAAKWLIGSNTFRNMHEKHCNLRRVRLRNLWRPADIRGRDASPTRDNRVAGPAARVCFRVARTRG